MAESSVVTTSEDRGSGGSRDVEVWERDVRVTEGRVSGGLPETGDCSPSDPGQVPCECGDLVLRGSDPRALRWTSSKSPVGPVTGGGVKTLPCPPP